jgi:hypothetical protein
VYHVRHKDEVKTAGKVIKKVSRWKKFVPPNRYKRRRGKMSEKDVGEALVQVIRDPQGSASQESFARAMELTKAYAGSGSATHFSAVARLFYDLFEMFETGADPRKK